ncbi:protein takeout [Drosophila innubila]|uniref:protein takeout n=1 Tax=Drosophila innubila TaxID=198719 RepID=UPI00148D6F75|nr:protein takeout [Drosophila innubila]
MAKMWSCVTVLLLHSIINYFVNCELPSEIEKCVAGDVICIVETINHIVQNYPNGIPEIGLDSLNAISFNGVVVSEAVPNTPMQMNLKFRTLTVRGFENTTILRAKGFDKDLRHGFELSGWTPSIHLDGIYEADGKLMMLPIQGRGQAQVLLTNCQFTCRAKAIEDLRTDGKRYAQITRVKCLVDIHGLHVNFDNLLDNKELSDSMNELINSNWRDVWHTFRKGISSAVDNVAESILKRVVNKLSHDDFYKHL